MAIESTTAEYLLKVPQDPLRVWRFDRRVG